MGFRSCVVLKKIANATWRTGAIPLNKYFPRRCAWMYDIWHLARSPEIGTVFDVGANTGQTTEGLLRFFPQARIYSFEPISSSFRLLKERFGERAYCLHLALGSKREERGMRLRRSSDMNSFLSTDETSDIRGEIERVSVSTVDEFCAQHKIGQIDILKMDVQGWEIEVLDGAARMLRNGQVRFVFSEVGFQRNTETVMFADLNTALVKSGFLFSGFYDFYRRRDAPEYTIFANALYINPRFSRK